MIEVISEEEFHQLTDHMSTNRNYNLFGKVTEHCTFAGYPLVAVAKEEDNHSPNVYYKHKKFCSEERVFKWHVARVDIKTLLETKTLNGDIQQLTSMFRLMGFVQDAKY